MVGRQCSKQGEKDHEQNSLGAYIINERKYSKDSIFIMIIAIKVKKKEGGGRGGGDG